MPDGTEATLDNVALEGLSSTASTRRWILPDR
jgi:hypothetical protein